MIVRLPSNLTETSMSILIKQIERLKGTFSSIVLDFYDLQIANPVCVLALAQYLGYYIIQQDVKIRFINADADSRILNYLRTIGFFRYFDNGPLMRIDTDYIRTYIPFSTIEWRDLQSRVYDEKMNGKRIQIQDVIEEISENYTRWMFDVTDPVISYCFREIIRNVFEHTNCHYCSIFGQIYSNSDRIEVCVADSGKGIRESLFPKYGPMISDGGALFCSILPGVTSEDVKNGSVYDNSGFGLYVLSEIARKIGTMWIGSGKKILKISEHGDELLEGFYPGTFVGFSFRYRHLLNNKQLVYSIINKGEYLSKIFGLLGKASISTRIV